jgi:hypothetical protein
MIDAKEYAELAIQIGKLIERAEELKRENDRLRKANIDCVAWYEQLKSDMPIKIAEAVKAERERCLDRFWDWFCGKLGDNLPATKNRIAAILYPSAGDDKEVV